MLRLEITLILTQLDLDCMSKERTLLVSKKLLFEIRVQGNYWGHWLEIRVQGIYWGH